MQISQEVVNYGLLSELAYLKLENYNGSYSDVEKLTSFLTQSKSTTGIEDSRDSTMLTLLSNYTILDFKTTDSGMQAMFVRNNATGETTLLFRGTEFELSGEGYKDAFKADGYMALGGSTQQMQDARDYANSLKTTGVTDDNGNTVYLTSTTVVAGHSLGGSLTQVVAYEQGLEAYAYNPFGVNRNSIMADIVNGDASGIHTFQQGQDLVSGIGTTAGGLPGGVFAIAGLGGLIVGATLNSYLNSIESAHLGEVTVFASFYSDSGLFADHRIVGFTNTISIYKTYLVELFRTDDIDTITKKIADFSVIKDQTTENIGIPRIVEYIAKAMGLNDLENVDFNDYAQVESILSSALESSDHNGFIDLTLFSANDLVSFASTSKAILYAVVNNNFITLNNESYAIYSDLNLDDYSDTYLDKRSEMLYYTIHPQSANTGNGIYYQDDTLNIHTQDKLMVNYANGSSSFVEFGTEKKDDLVGFDNNDYLFGGAGDDTLVGQGGNDYLEGGKDFDTYIAGDGDTIYDSDGKGKVEFEDIELKGAVWNSLIGKYESISGKGETYSLEDDELSIAYEDKKLTIKDFSKEDKSLGIDLNGYVSFKIEDTTFMEEDSNHTEKITFEKIIVLDDKTTMSHKALNDETYTFTVDGKTILTCKDFHTNKSLHVRIKDKQKEITHGVQPKAA